MTAPEEKRRWWGWGLDEVEPPHTEGLYAYLSENLSPWPESGLSVPDIGDLDIRPPFLPQAFRHDLETIMDSGQIRTDRASRVFHAMGRSYRDLIRLRTGRIPAPPDVVVYPTSHIQVRRILDVAARHGAAVIPFGGGSSVVGGLEPAAELRPVICMDMVRMNRVLEIDPISLTARVEAGIYGPDLEQVLGNKGYTLGHFPQSFEFSTLGGWIATRGAGHKSNRYGKIEDMVLSLKAALPGDEIQTPQVPAAAAGGDLTQLLIGSEGALGVITEARVKIHPLPEAEWFSAYLFPDFHAGCTCIREIMALGLSPATIRLSDEDETRALMAEASAKETGGSKRFIMEKIAPRYLSFKGVDINRCCLLLAVGEGSPAEIRAEKKAVAAMCKAHGGVKAGSGPARAWHETRYGTPYLRDEMLGRGLLVETLETAATWDNLNKLYNEVRKAVSGSLNVNGRKGVVMTHLSHTYPQGANLYFTFIGPMEQGAEEEQWLRIKTAATNAIVENQGSLSHHHGVGRDHKPWMEKFWGKELAKTFRQAKTTLDPQAVCNPGVVLDPEPAVPLSGQTGRFSPQARERNLTRLTEGEFDLLVVGGGAVGAGAAWDAVMRGLTVALVEMNDFGSGTSGKSSRMIHGGLRYLKMLDLKLVRESLAERHHLVRMAPHLVRPARHLVPVYKGEGDSRRVMHLGLWGYDTLAGSKGLPHHESLTAEEILELEPNIRDENLEGGLVYYDALTDDARLTLEVAKAASRNGAVVLNHLQVTGLDMSSESATVHLLDRMTQANLRAKAKVVVNAAGVWSDRVRSAADPKSNLTIQPSKGIHITIPHHKWPIEHVLILKGTDGRPLFAVPSGQVVYVGTTDTRYDGEIDAIHADTDEVDYLIEAANLIMTGDPITRDDVVSTWAGARPLVANSDKEETKDISREHDIKVEKERLVTVCGGKLTTFRIMAAQTVDRVMTILTGEALPESPTTDMPLCPPGPRSSDLDRLPEAVADRLEAKYGPQASEIALLTRSPVFGAVLNEELGVTAAEIHYAVMYEMAQTLEDVMVRRLGLMHLTSDNGLRLAPRVAQQMAGLLGWSEEQTRDQIAAYAKYVSDELAFHFPATTSSAPEAPDA
jgi:alkyldihydroxyacetonephosphate synthase